MKPLIYVVNLSQDNSSVTGQINLQKFDVIELNQLEELTIDGPQLPLAIIINVSTIEQLSTIRHLSPIDIPIIITNTNDSSYARLLASSLSAHAYLTEPVDQINLECVLENLYYVTQTSGQVILITADTRLSTIYRKELETQDINVVVLYSAEAALDHIMLNETCDLIICDSIIKGEFTRVDLCAAIRHLNCAHQIPIIVLADSLNQQDRSRIFKLENVYVVPRYTNHTHLSHAIKSNIATWRSSKHTMLTNSSNGTYSRVHIMQLVQVAINQLQWNHQTLCLFSIGFERRMITQLNYYDIEQILIQLHQLAPSNSLLGQLNTYEFLIILPDVDSQETRELINQFTDSIPQLLANACFGIACWTAGENAHSLVDRAKRALLLARSQGPGSCIET